MNPHETWVPVAGFEGLYEVSDQGRVRSVDRTIARSDGRTQRHVGRVLRPGFGKRGYGTVNLCAGPRQQTGAVHKLVAVAFLGPGRRGHQVNHRNGNKRDNRASNLEWVTQSENAIHALESGLSVRGESSPHAKLTTKDVLEIRRLAGRVSQRSLSRRFGVSPRNIGLIVRRTTWAHLDSERRPR